MIPKCKQIEKKFDYSTEERVIGKWIDGKNLYEKTIYIESLPNTNTGFYPIFADTSNIDRIFINEGTSVILTEDEYEQFPVNWYYHPTGASIMTSIMNKHIRIVTSDDKSKAKAYITVRYTKVTD